MIKKYQIVITPHDAHNVWCQTRSKGVCSRNVEWKIWVVENDKYLLYQATTCDYHLQVAVRQATQEQRASQTWAGQQVRSSEEVGSGRGR